MAAVKTMREKMADEGLVSYTVTFMYPGNRSLADTEQFWAEDADHAREQCIDSHDEITIKAVETQDEFEARTDLTLDYGNRSNV